MTNESYREKLRKRQQQEAADKGKTGLGRVDVLDFSKANKEVKNYEVKTGTKKEDENVIDILPFRITQSWYKDLRMPSGRATGLDVGDLDYKLQIPIHRGMGPNKTDAYVCMREAFGKSCVRCDEMFEAYKEGDKIKGQLLNTQWVTFYNAYDYDDDARGIQLWRISYKMFETTTANDPQRMNLLDAAQLDDGGVILFSDLEEGKTIVAKFKEKTFNKNSYAEVYDIRFEDRDPYNESILDEVYPLDSMLIILDEETFRSAHYGLDTESEANPGDVQEKIESEQTSRRTRGQREQPVTTIRQGGNPVDAPPWDKEGEWGQCPAGHRWGYDCNKQPDCEGIGESKCTEEHFRTCAETMNKIAAQPVLEPELEKQKEESVPASGGRRRRR